MAERDAQLKEESDAPHHRIALRPYAPPTPVVSADRRRRSRTRRRWFARAPGAAPAAESQYYAIYAQHSLKCLDNFSMSRSDRQFLEVAQSSCRGKCGQRPWKQQWRFEQGPKIGGRSGSSRDDYYYYVINRQWGKCLDVAHKSVGHAAPVVQATCHGGSDQQWLWQPLGDGWYRVIARHSRKCLDAAHASIGSWVQIVQGTCVEPGYNQRWKLEYQG